MGNDVQTNSAVTTGDLADEIYWRAKFAHLKLEAAIASAQSSQAVANLAASALRRTARVLHAYPNHHDVAAWRERALAVAAQIDLSTPPAGLRADFDCWLDAGYEAGWCSYHLSRMATASRDVRLALSHARDASMQLTRVAARMGGWPVDVQRFVVSALAEMNRLGEQVRTRLSA